MDQGALRIVENYMKLWIQSLSVPAVLFTRLQLVAVFGLQQGGGVPNPNNEQGERTTLGVLCGACGWPSCSAAFGLLLHR